MGQFPKYCTERKQRGTNVTILIVDTNHPNWQGYAHLNNLLPRKRQFKIYEWENDRNRGSVMAVKRPEPKPPGAKIEGKIGRNDLCPCGSSKKYKKCCLRT